MLAFLMPLFFSAGSVYVVPEYLLEFKKPPHLVSGRPVATQYYCRWEEETRRTMAHHRQAGFPKEVVVEKFQALQPHVVTQNTLLAVLDVFYDKLTDDMIKEAESTGNGGNLAYTLSINSQEDCIRRVDRGRAIMSVNPELMTDVGKDFYKTVVLP